MTVFLYFFTTSTPFVDDLVRCVRALATEQINRRLDANVCWLRFFLMHFPRDRSVYSVHVGPVKRLYSSARRLEFAIWDEQQRLDISHMVIVKCVFYVMIAVDAAAVTIARNTGATCITSDIRCVSFFCSSCVYSHGMKMRKYCIIRWHDGISFMRWLFLILGCRRYTNSLCCTCACVCLSQCLN